ncbi:hypothetical protein RI367_003425 [Sorochytrium milnesiophthora]
MSAALLLRRPPWLQRIPALSRLQTWAAAAVTVASVLVSVPWLWASVFRPQPSALIKKHQASILRNGKLFRVLRIPHPAGNNVPTLVFVHGMGGNMMQFAPLIELYAGNVNIFAVDWVGHGGSPDTGRVADYQTLSITRDVDALVDELAPSHNLVFVCHSYGCCIGTHILSPPPSMFPSPKCTARARAAVFLAPKAFISEHERHQFRTQLARTPTVVIDVLRYLDRRGGPLSSSVRRQLGTAAPMSLRRQQLEWNKQITSWQLKAILHGANTADQWVTEESYRGIRVPVLLIAGEEDKVTPYKTNLLLIDKLLAVPHPEPFVIPGVGHQVMTEEPDMVHAITNYFLVQKCHIAEIDPTHSLQLHYSSSAASLLSSASSSPGDNAAALDNTLADSPAEKWSLKNTAKWNATHPVGGLVGTSRLRGMKIPRSGDAVHSPTHLKQRYPRIGLVIDISKDAPSYDVEELERGGQVQYHKLSTASKIPPTRDDVAKFCAVVQAFLAQHPDKEIAVHCHYGFNRTGFMVCCYLTQMLNVPVADAIKAYAAARQPGIRHLHFKDELYLRYRPRNRVRSITGGEVRVAEEG